MVRAMDLYLCKQNNVTPLEKHPVPKVELEMSGEINERTRIPIGWAVAVITTIVAGCCTLVGVIVVYITTVNTKHAVMEVSVKALDDRVTSLEGSWKQAFEDIKGDIREVRNYVHSQDPKKSRDSK